MRLTNRKFLSRISIFLFFFACIEDDPAVPFGNPLDTPPGLTNELNLQSNSGVQLNSVTLTWNNLGSAELTDHTLDNQFPLSDNSYTFSEMTPGEFRDISIKISSSTAGFPFLDTLQIYTRSVQSVENFEYNIQPRWETDGVWDEGEEFYNEFESPDGNGFWNEGESFTDGNMIYDEGEEFTDEKNGIWDEGEEFIDCSLDNPLICAGDELWTAGLGNENWDEGEEFTDEKNGIWDEGEEFIDEKNGIWDEGEEFIDGNGVYDEGEEFIDGIEVYDRKLQWQVIEEEAFSKYFIYRVPRNNVDRLIDPEECNCLIATLSLPSTDSYTDTDPIVLTEPEEKAFYYLIQVSTEEFTRNSFIYNYTECPQVGPLSGITVSTNKIELIEISWDTIDITNSIYVYQYEISRFKGNPSLDNDTLLIAIIPNAEINHFIDRGSGFSDGTTYYYSVAVRKINGNVIPSPFIAGFAYPW